MSLFKHKFESVKQEWTTPASLFEALDREFQFGCDLAANQDNTKCACFFSEKDDALKQPWEGVCWLNPPYGLKKSSLKRWVIKAYNESKTGRCRVVMLIPARTNTTWFRDYCMKGEEVRFICGRPKFGNAAHGLPQPLMIVVFGPSNLENAKVSVMSLRPICE